MLVGMRSLLILAGLAMALAASAQDIYRWVDKDGVVHYSDQPGSDKAVLITVIEPNTFESDDSGASAASAGSSPAEEEPAEGGARYRGLSIVAPAPDQVFFGADATVTATAELDGTLGPEHTVAFFLNGARRETDGLSADFGVLPRGSYFLRASVLNRDGTPVISSPQVTFHVRQPSINSPQSPQAPRPPQPRPPRPTPNPGR